MTPWGLEFDFEVFHQVWAKHQAGDTLLRLLVAEMEKAKLEGDVPGLMITKEQSKGGNTGTDTNGLKVYPLK